jgi:glucose-6-phosphate dehydrogenase assembly protein OpcA
VTPLAETVEATLADLRSLEAGEAGGMQTHILDLLVVCDGPDAVEEISDVIAGLPYNRPSRSLVALAIDDDAGTTFDARVFCTAGGSEGSLVCSDLVTLTAGLGGLALPSLVQSLLLPDLPVFLLWRAEPGFAPLVLDQLWAVASRVVVDSTLEEGTLEALPRLLQREPERHVTDLSWTKVTGWRDAVARPFDVPENARALDRLDRIEIHHAGRSDAQARLTAAWLVSRTGRRSAEIVITSHHRRDMRSGSLTRVVLRCAGEEFSVERLEEGMARVCAPRLEDHVVPLRVPHARELLAQELEIFHRDVIFEEAVRAL